MNKSGQKRRVNFRVRQNLLTRLDPNTSSRVETSHFSSRVITRSIRHPYTSLGWPMLWPCNGRQNVAVYSSVQYSDSDRPSHWIVVCRVHFRKCVCLRGQVWIIFVLNDIINLNIYCICWKRIEQFINMQSTLFMANSHTISKLLEYVCLHAEN